MTSHPKHDKMVLTLRYFLLGAQYYKALEGMEFAMFHHTGTRKDGVTPEFHHQVMIAHYIRTLLPSLLYPEDTITAVLLHDVTEDYNVPHDEINKRFGERVGHSVFLMDKNGKTAEQYIRGMSTDAIASIGKGADRINNMSTMSGVFSMEKQQKYINEVRQVLLPMVKIARRQFPQQEPAYENVKHVLELQCNLIEATIGAKIEAK